MSVQEDAFRKQRRFRAPTASKAYDAYMCVLCRELLDLDRPHQSSCGDRACYTCLEVLITAFKERGLSVMACPGCQDPLQPSSFFPDRAVARELRSIPVICPNNCKWSNTYQHYPDHLTTCPLEPVTCPHSPCPTRVERNKLESHIVVCIYRPVTCQYCSKMMFFKDLEVHETTECERRPVACTLCGTRVPFNAVSPI
jgi:hypothetical protein